MVVTGLFRTISKIAGVGSVDIKLAKDLAASAGLQRVIETGTYHGRTARLLAEVFPEVITIERDAALHRDARRRLADLVSVTAVQGHSVARLAELADHSKPTLFFLDGHWSGADTAGEEDECPVLAELGTIGAGNATDCFIIDDARLFTSAPPPPHRPEQWPTIAEVFDAVRMGHPEHFVTLLNDQVLAVPQAGRSAVDSYAKRLQSDEISVADRLKGLTFNALQRMKRA